MTNCLLLGEAAMVNAGRWGCKEVGELCHEQETRKAGAREARHGAIAVSLGFWFSGLPANA